MYELGFEKIYDPLRVLVSVEETPDNVFKTGLIYWNLRDNNWNYTPEGVTGPNVARALEMLCEQTREDPELSGVTAQDVLLSDCMRELSDHIIKIYDWARHVKSDPPPKFPVAGSGKHATDNRLLIQLPERLPKFNYVHYVFLGSLNSRVAHYLDVSDEEVNCCIEVAPGINGSRWDGDKLYVFRKHQADFLKTLRATVRMYLNIFVARNHSNPLMQTFDGDDLISFFEEYPQMVFNEVNAGKEIDELFKNERS